MNASLKPLGSSVAVEAAGQPEIPKKGRMAPGNVENPTHSRTRFGLGLVFIDATDKAYPSIIACAEVRRDHAKGAEIWKRTDNAWWNGPDDQTSACCGRADQAELWDSPASAASSGV